MTTKTATKTTRQSLTCLIEKPIVDALFELADQRGVSAASLVEGAVLTMLIEAGAIDAGYQRTPTKSGRPRAAK